MRNSLKSLPGSVPFRRNVLEIREDLQPDEEWTRKECFSDAGADELLRAVREAAAKEVQRVIGEESCEANVRKRVFGDRTRAVGHPCGEMTGGKCSVLWTSVVAIVFARS